MASKNALLELIDDNPYNPRKHYPRNKVDSMAYSLEQMGLLEIPKAREVDDRVQLAAGHLRKLAFLKLQKKDPGKWNTMPLNIEPISDEDMFYYALEENLQRIDITPLEIARSIDSFLTIFPDKTEEEVAKKFRMAQPSVSNMRRVLRLPEKILEKIDEGRINFTQGRELLVLERLPNPEELMKTAISEIKTEKRPYGKPNTVEGMQEAVHSVVGEHTLPLDKQWEGYRHSILFDTRAAGCLKCDRIIITHPSKSVSAHWCLDEQCWEEHQEEQRKVAAAAAKAQMEADILRRTAQVIEEAAPSPVMIDENTVLVDQETFAKIEASSSANRISEGMAVRKPVEFEGILYVATGGGMGEKEAYQLVPRAEFTGEVRTYKVPAGREYGEYYESLRSDPNGFYHGMLVKRGKEEHILVGPELTFVTKVDEGDLSQEKLEEQMEDQADERDRQMEEAAERANLERPVGELPCETCSKGEVCDRSLFHVADDDSGRLVCEQWDCELEQDISRRIAAAPAPTPQEIPDDILALAKEKAGTRAEVLDVNEILIRDDYQHQVKQHQVNSGYTILKGWYHDGLRYMDDPDECTERCTEGFHFGFDSKDTEGNVFYICTNAKCAAQKKAAFTRKKNAEGQARKRAETKAIKEAIAQTTTLDRPRIKLILLAQMDGQHCSRSYFNSGKKPETWLWDKVSAGTPAVDQKRADLFKRIDKLSDEELARLVVEFMVYHLVDHGDIGSYEIKAAEPLKWMGVTIQTEMTGGESSE